MKLFIAFAVAATVGASVENFVPEKMQKPRRTLINNENAMTKKTSQTLRGQNEDPAVIAAKLKMLRGAKMRDPAKRREVFIQRRFAKACQDTGSDSGDPNADKVGDECTSPDCWKYDYGCCIPGCIHHHGVTCKNACRPLTAAQAPKWILGEDPSCNSVGNFCEVGCTHGSGCDSGE